METDTTLVVNMEDSKIRVFNEDPVAICPLTWVSWMKESQTTEVLSSWTQLHLFNFRLKPLSLCISGWLLTHNLSPG